MLRNKRFIVFFILFVISIQSSIFSTDTMTTSLPDGRKVILYPDGKWIFAENDIYKKETLLSIPTKREFSHPPFNEEDLSSDYFLQTKYDKFKNMTIVKISLKLQKQHDELSLSSFFFYDGNVPTRPPKILLGFHSVSKDWLYLKNSHLTMLIDGNRKDFGVMEQDGSVGNGYVLEHMHKIILLEEFLEIISAKNVEGRLFTTEFKLTNEQLEALRDFASRMN